MSNIIFQEEIKQEFSSFQKLSPSVNVASAFQPYSQVDLEFC